MRNKAGRKLSMMCWLEKIRRIFTNDKTYSKRHQARLVWDSLWEGVYDRSLVCSMVNTVEKIDRSLFSTSKDDRANHGFGLQNIWETLEKYDSEPTIKWKNGIFQLSFTIFIWWIAKQKMFTNDFLFGFFASYVL